MKQLFIFLICCSLAPVFGQEKGKKASNPEVLFTVGKQSVTTSDFIYLYKKNNANKPEDFTNEKIEEYLQLYVNFKLKVAEAYGQGIDTTKAFRQEFEQYREEIKKPYVSDGDDLDRLVKEAYQRSTEQVRASHLLIMSNNNASPEDTLAAWNKITGIRERAVKGEDFGELAKEYSEDPSAKSSGGDLGYFSSMDMVYPFESAAYKTKVGDISPIVKTRFGYHILKVTDHRPSMGEIEVSHIMIRTGKGDDAKVRNTIFEINDQLKAGRKWEELCQEYSEDPNTKNNGGKLPPFKMGTFAISAPQFEEAAFALQNLGDTSDPIQTPFGWHIVRLEKKIPVPEFKDVQASLTRKIARDERLQLSKMARIATLKKSFGFTEYLPVKTLALSQADSTLQKATWTYSNLKGTICSIGNIKYDALEFLKYVKANQSRNNLAPKVYMEQLYEKWVDYQLNLEEEKKLIEKNPEFKSMLNEYREGILLFTVMEKEVWNKASADTVGQRNFYVANQSKYKAGDRIHTRIFASDNKQSIDDFKTKVALGDSITNQDLRKFKSVSGFRSYEKGESKVTDKINWTVGLQETELDGVYYLCDIDQLIPPGIKTFDEARANVISDYQDQLEKEWLVKLRKKYPVSISSKGKKTVIKELTAKQ